MSFRASPCIPAPSDQQSCPSTLLVLVYRSRSGHVNSMVSASERPGKYVSEARQARDKLVDLGCYIGRINSIFTSPLLVTLPGFIYSKSLGRIEPKHQSTLV